MSDSNALAAKVADAVVDAIEHHGRINRDDLIAAAAGAIARHEIARSEVAVLAKRRVSDPPVMVAPKDNPYRGMPEDQAVALFQEHARQRLERMEKADAEFEARQRAIRNVPSDVALQGEGAIRRYVGIDVAGDSGMPPGWRHEKQEGSQLTIPLRKMSAKEVGRLYGQPAPGHVTWVDMGYDDPFYGRVKG